MPVIYQCGNCGADHIDLTESDRTCTECGSEVCVLCIEAGKCYTCAEVRQPEPPEQQPAVPVRRQRYAEPEEDDYDDEDDDY